ncbi:MAG: gamma-glutamyltransferase [Fimbriimonadaceae bacterium]
MILPVLVAQTFHSVSPAYGDHAMVSSPEPLATQIGVEILKKGGNAFDAAVAVNFAIAVTYPTAGNIGGGGFAVGMTSKGQKFSLDFREVAPKKAKRNMYLDQEGEVINGLSTDSHLAVGVPGSVDGMVQLHEKYGKLKWSEVVEPAVRLAQDGFQVRGSLNASLNASKGDLSRYESSKAVFFRDGEVIPEGAILRIPDLARTLTEVKAKKRAGFYDGWVADAIVADMKANKGLITQEDLRDYRSKWREPITVKGDGVELVTMPLPSSGGITLGQTFGLLDWKYLKSQKQNSAGAIQHITEALRLSYADRNYFLGDPDFVDVPAKKLLDPAYLAQRKKLMPRGKAGSSKDVDHGTPEHMETTHFCIVDKDGNVCAVTTTLNGGYGIGAVVPGAGFIWNNEMDDFTSKPGSPNRYGLLQGEANAIAPGKKMLSSMTPSIFLKDGKFWMTAGSPGGPTIITTVLQVFLNTHVWNMDIQRAVDAPRFHHQHFPDNIRLEPGIESTADLLKMGYELDQRKAPWGQASAIMRLPSGKLSGGFDSRGDGLSAGY